MITRWRGTVGIYTSTPTSAIPPASGPNFTNTVVGGEFPVPRNVNSLNMAVTASELVRFCPFELQNGAYTVVINPNFAGITAIAPEVANIRAGSGDTIATAYVASRLLYQDGRTNYAAVWEFVRQSSGKAKIVMRDSFVKGRTKAHQEDAIVLAVQYWGRT
jgi:hypothetical protein